MAIGHPARFPLCSRPAPWRGRRGRHGLAVHQQHEPAADTLALASIEVDLSPIAGRPGDHREVARQAGLHPPPHAGGDRGGRVRSSSAELPRSADRRARATHAKKAAEWLVLVGICTHLGCVPLGNKRATRAAITAAGSAPATARTTTRRAASARAGAREPGSAGLRVHVRHPRQHRLSGQELINGARRTAAPPVFKNPVIALDRRPPADLPYLETRVPRPSRRRGTSTISGTSARSPWSCWCMMIVTGIVLAMHYTPHVDDGLRLGRAHHARRQLRLADPLHPHERRVDVLHRRLHPHLPRPVLRLLQGAARAAVDPGRRHLPADDGDRLHGLRAALGPDELLGRHRHHQPVLGHSRWSAITS